MLPARDGEISTINGYKFHVAGGVTGLSVVDQDTLDAGLDVQAFDRNGNPLAIEVTATVASIN